MSKHWHYHLMGKGKNEKACLISFRRGKTARDLNLQIDMLGIIYEETMRMLTALSWITKPPKPAEPVVFY